MCWRSAGRNDAALEKNAACMAVKSYSNRGVALFNSLQEHHEIGRVRCQ